MSYKDKNVQHRLEEHFEKPLKLRMTRDEKVWAQPLCNKE